MRYAGKYQYDQAIQNQTQHLISQSTLTQSFQIPKYHY